ncbi:imidazole glycerol phosphate synthase subunit HisH [Vibrio sp. SS-MA-C1-2]|nr:imidazole glycerol phosphate synthase subunit HisH [Vibrio sp. SS-MA-C1-2]UJF19811.1 imidazole glycerol phosphate synthase subunit HisH [Vibrio sp. SS-MA-C1-2]
MANVVIIDTGCANISSLRFAIERLGFSVEISRDPATILAADKLFLPGVGTASEAMKNLEQRDLISLIKQVEKPLLGICLGMQLLGQISQEGKSPITCLGICPAPINKIQSGDLPLPHMGWNKISVKDQHPLFAGIDSDSYFYFVHSFAMPTSPEYTIASCQYGQDFTAAIQCGNYFGVQFHPERSSKVGAKLIQNFLLM